MIFAKKENEKFWEKGGCHRLGVFRLFSMLVLFLVWVLFDIHGNISFKNSVQSDSAPDTKKAAPHGDLKHLAFGLESPMTIAPLPPNCDEFHQAVEIGTSNFNTFIQEAKPSDTGLSIDVMKIYIDQLPNMTCWRKFNTAVVGKADDVPENGLAQAYFIYPSDITKYNLPKWLTGCNSVNRPHPTGAKHLKNRNLSHLMQNISVPVVSVEHILEKFGVCRMGTFKVDVEGLDGDLLVAFSEWVKKSDGCYADEVTGEFNELSHGRTSGVDVDVALSRVGYKNVRKGLDWRWKFQGD